MFDVGKITLAGIDRHLTETFEYRNVGFGDKLIMANQKYLDPAYGVIIRFSKTGQVMQAVAKVAEITGRTESWVYRWMLPKERGGTGGLIPSKDQKTIFEYARRTKMGLDASHFFSVAA